jgi:hypothetical protein
MKKILKYTAIIAYLRSDKPEVQASEKHQPRFEPSFLGKVLFTLAFQPLPYTGTGYEVPARTDQLAYGKYLVNNRLVCYDCHSGSFETNNVMEPEKSGRYLRGGNVIAGDFLEAPLLVPNITMDPDSGIGQWTEAEFSRAVRFGQHPEGHSLRFPMSPYSYLDSTDISAIYAYLKTVPTQADLMAGE